MPYLPRWRMQTFEQEGYYAIDWRETFASDLIPPGMPVTGEMRGFHVIFRLRVECSGKIVFIDSDGCVIRRNGTVVHEDRHAHGLVCHELAVSLGDRLEIAQWQHCGAWIWGVRLDYASNHVDTMPALLTSHWQAIDAALRHPNGPMLKIYTSANEPLRCALSVYSLVLNGYRPAGIQIYGDYQWDEDRRRTMRTLFPFADIVSIERVERMLDELDPRLAPLARRFWLVMKICVCLFLAPREFCYLDDDIFVIDRIDDALAAFTSHDLVYAPDDDYDAQYRAIWCPERTLPLPTGNLNAGFYLARNRRDIGAQIVRLLRTPPRRQRMWLWEQGFVASEFAADGTASALPSQRYLYPVFDGLPGGLLGYDWANNPCGFTTVHFGGPRPKPSERDAAVMMRDILGRRTAAIESGGRAGRDSAVRDGPQTSVFSPVLRPRPTSK
jgi:hypothetical protein